MWDWSAILARGGDIDSELYYVIAVLILAGLGKVADMIKKRREEEAGPKRQRPVPPPRPAAKPEPPRQAPRPPVVWETPQPRRPQRPQPQPSAAPRPVAQKPARPPSPPPSRRVLTEPVEAKAEARPVGQVMPTIGQQMGRATPAAPSVAVLTQLAAEPEVTVLAEAPAVAAKAGIGPVKVLGFSPAELPRAVIFAEILAPPLALREQEHLF